MMSRMTGSDGEVFGDESSRRAEICDATSPSSGLRFLHHQSILLAYTSVSDGGRSVMAALPDPEQVQSLHYRARPDDLPAMSTAVTPGLCIGLPVSPRTPCMTQLAQVRVGDVTTPTGLRRRRRWVTLEASVNWERTRRHSMEVDVVSGACLCLVVAGR